MKDFILLFRQAETDPTDASPKEMEEVVRRWEAWIGGIAAQDKLTSQGNRLSGEGKVLKPGGVITDGLLWRSASGWAASSSSGPKTWTRPPPWPMAARCWEWAAA